jgi:hypothetical protein
MDVYNKEKVEGQGVELGKAGRKRSRKCSDVGRRALTSFLIPVRRNRCK